MNYKDTSAWNDLNEIRCLRVLKILMEENFPRNRQMQLCREIACKSNLSSESLSAKVSNYKSLAGINNKSNASTNSKIIFEKYKQYSIPDLDKIITTLTK